MMATPAATDLVEVDFRKKSIFCSRTAARLALELFKVVSHEKRTPQFGRHRN
jgi:hypothetical protein